MERNKEPTYFEARQVAPPRLDDCRLEKYIVDILPEKKDSRILEIGCGYGQKLKALKDMGFSEVRGIDVDGGAVRYCQQNGLAVIQDDVNKYCERTDEKYDIIIMSHVLEHIQKEEIIPTLSNIKNRLVEKGSFLLMVPNAQSNTGCYWAYEDFTHSTLFTSGSVFYTLRMAGFSVVEFIDVDGLGESVGLIWIIKKFLLWLYRRNRWF